jgi:hypothetical protein
MPRCGRPPTVSHPSTLPIPPPAQLSNLLCAPSPLLLTTRRPPPAAPGPGLPAHSEVGTNPASKTSRRGSTRMRLRRSQVAILIRRPCAIPEHQGEDIRAHRLPARPKRRTRPLGPPRRVIFQRQEQGSHSRRAQRTGPRLYPRIRCLATRSRSLVAYPSLNLPSATKLMRQNL